jgi:hypothetical protein
VITSAKKLLGENEQNLGKWVQVTPDEEEAVRDSVVGSNYERGAVGRPTLRMYSRDGYVVLCTRDVMAETHPNDLNGNKI